MQNAAALHDRIHLSACLVTRRQLQARQEGVAESQLPQYCQSLLRGLGAVLSDYIMLLCMPTCIPALSH
jgi:hypothetical protein